MDKNVFNAFSSFTEKYLTPSNRERWDNVFKRGEKSWSKIDIWMIWEDDFCNKGVKRKEWTEKFDALIEWCKQNNNDTQFLILGLGHNIPVSIVVNKSELRDYAYKLLEGLILVKDNSYAIAINHDGDSMILSANKINTEAKNANDN